MFNDHKLSSPTISPHQKGGFWHITALHQIDSVLIQREDNIALRKTLSFSWKCLFQNFSSLDLFMIPHRITTQGSLAGRHCLVWFFCSKKGAVPCWQFIP